jgi:hypothetical protein
MVPPPIPTPAIPKGVDDLIRSGFEAYRESCFNWLLVATGLVIVRLLFEAFELVPDIVLIIRRKRRERRLGIKLLNVDIPEWAKTVAFVGWFLIAADRPFQRLQSIRSLASEACQHRLVERSRQHGEQDGLR